MPMIYPIYSHANLVIHSINVECQIISFIYYYYVFKFYLHVQEDFSCDKSYNLNVCKKSKRFNATKSSKKLHVMIVLLLLIVLEPLKMF